MTARRCAWRVAFATCALLLGAAAGAAEITFYEYPNFGGARVTLRGWTPNIGATGFANRASSVVVESGRWEVCSEPDFRGTCMTFVRGEYPALDARLSNRISSVREIGSYGERQDAYSDWGRGQIELFAKPGFGGPSLRLERDQPAFRASGFNDRAASLVVSSGVWELCTDDNFRGECRRFPPGRYADLGYGLTNQISSARLVRPPEQAPAVLGYGPPSAPPNAPARIVLYEDPRLAGRSVAVAAYVVDAERLGLGEEGAWSAYVESGTWQACSRPAFAGHCVQLVPGRYDNFADIGLRRGLGSLRPVAATPAAPPPPPLVPARPAGRPDAVVLYTERDFGGENLTVGSDVPSMDFYQFRNRATSAIVNAGQWEICVEPQYSGGCTVLAPGRYPNLGGFARNLASMRRLN